ncbi:hypothetical protein [Nocardia crassostreae]|uniref:hypothetical protein n=1 Tax=Nocardia crassostreae TaxID=53428 RepID=UPI0008322D15|nr:hypothetical protein [Nocardia crassostreae]
MDSDVASAESVETDAVARPKKPKTTAVDSDLVGQRMVQARASGLQLTGEGGLLGHPACQNR